MPSIRTSDIPDTPGFFKTLAIGINRANSQIPAILKALLALFVYALRDFAVPAVIFGGSFYVRSKLGSQPWQVYGEIIAVLWAVVLLTKYDGAFGVLFGLISIGKREAWATASFSQKNGIKFFVNAWRTGIILIFGQILVVCPCFLALNNFIFSPYLFIYEDIRGTAAKQRSKEIVAGFGWPMLNRTAALILSDYLLLLLALLFLFLRNNLWLNIAFVLIALYLAAVQCNMIRIYYEQAMQWKSGELLPPRASSRMKWGTAMVVVGVLMVYIVFKLIANAIK